MQHYLQLDRRSAEADRRSAEASTIALRAAACAIAFALVLTVFLPWIEGRGVLLGESKLSLFDLTVDDGYEALRPYRELAMMVGGVLLVMLTCGGGVSGPAERRRAIGRGAGFALAAIPACDLVLGDLLFDRDYAVTVQVGAYALLVVAITGIAICCVSSSMAGRLPQDELDDGGAGTVISALCWGALITYLVMTGTSAFQEVSALRLEGDARRDVYGHFAVVALSVLAAAAMPYLAWLVSRFGSETAPYVLNGNVVPSGKPRASAGEYRESPYAARSAARSGGYRESPYPARPAPGVEQAAVPTGVWRAQKTRRPYMYASYDGVTVWEDGRCDVAICHLPAHAPVVVLGEIGPFYRVRLADGSHGVVEHRGLRG